LGLSNFLSVVLLSLVYGTVLKVPDPLNYAIYLGVGLTAWGIISQSMIAGCTLFSNRRAQLINNSLPAIFFCLEEWAFQIQTFSQALLIILIPITILKPITIIHMLYFIWMPLLNLSLFCLLALICMAILCARFKDVGQLTPIILQLVFLLSPILYPKKSLGSLSIFAEINPLYRVLHSLRAAIIDGKVDFAVEFTTLIILVATILMSMRLLKTLRYKLPLWV
jgi:lipopolysaccharide transport system permease protein